MKHAKQLQQLINDFSQLVRAHYLPGYNKREDILLHSFSVTLLCWQLFEETKPKLDLGKCILYALVHDLPEVYAGDTNAFAQPSAREQKDINEAKALERLFSEYNAHFPSLTTALKEYQSMENQEAVFVWSVDKIQAQLQGHIDHFRPFYEQGITKQECVSYYKGVGEKIHPALRQVFNEYTIEWLSDYDDAFVHPKGNLIIRNDAPRQ